MKQYRIIICFKAIEMRRSNPVFFQFILNTKLIYGQASVNLQFYDMNNQIIGYKNNEDADVRPEALQRFSMKGLFTFYREQQQLEQREKKHKIQHKHLKLIRIKTEQKGDQKEIIQPVKSHKKKRSKTKKSNQSLSQEKKPKKRKKKSQKHFKSRVEDSHELQNDLNNINDRQKYEEQQEPFVRFLKRIHQSKKNRSHKNSLSAVHEQTSENTSYVEDMNEKFNKLVYPKNSIEAQIKINNFRNKLQKKIQQHLNQNCVIIRRQDLIEKKKIVIDDIFQKRSASRIKKSFVTRKRLFTQLPVQQRNVDIHVKNNFYSHSKKNIIENLTRDEPNGPISPPTSTRVIHSNEIQQIHKLRNSQKLKSSSNNLSQPLKLPHINKVRLSKELGKISQVISQQLCPVYRYDSTKSKKSSKKVSKTSSESKIKLKKKQKESKNLTKKITEAIEEQSQGKCFMALIDLSKSEQKNSEASSWNEKKKLLFKKLGLKI